MFERGEPCASTENAGELFYGAENNLGRGERGYYKGKSWLCKYRERALVILKRGREAPNTRLVQSRVCHISASQKKSTKSTRLREQQRSRRSVSSAEFVSHPKRVQQVFWLMVNHNLATELRNAAGKSPFPLKSLKSSHYANQFVVVLCGHPIRVGTLKKKSPFSWILQNTLKALSSSKGFKIKTPLVYFLIISLCKIPTLPGFPWHSKENRENATRKSIPWVFPAQLVWGIGRNLWKKQKKKVMCKVFVDVFQTKGVLMDFRERFQTKHGCKPWHPSAAHLPTFLSRSKKDHLKSPQKVLLSWPFYPVALWSHQNTNIHIANGQSLALGSGLNHKSHFSDFLALRKSCYQDDNNENVHNWPWWGLFLELNILNSKMDHWAVWTAAGHEVKCFV